MRASHCQVDSRVLRLSNTRVPYALDVGEISQATKGIPTSRVGAAFQFPHIEVCLMMFTKQHLVGVCCNRNKCNVKNN